MQKRYSVHYVGTLEDGAEFANTWTGRAPIVVVPGSGEFLPAFEDAVCALGRGGKRVVTIPCAQAYGAYDPANVVTVPEGQVPNAEELPVGGFIEVGTPYGKARVRVLSREGGAVTLDCNHELAGHDLTFDIEVISDGTESIVERERLDSGGCSCGCDKLKHQLAPEVYGHHHHHDHTHA